jgi:hypothetical protein
LWSVAALATRRYRRQITAAAHEKIYYLGRPPPLAVRALKLMEFYTPSSFPLRVKTGLYEVKHLIQQ